MTKTKSKNKSKKKIEAPAVVHGSSEKEQFQWFKNTADEVKFKYNTVKNGKGSAPRTDINSKQYQDNYNSIDWGKSKGKQ